MKDLLSTRNSRAIPKDTVPVLSLEDFRKSIIEAPGRHRRVAALFAYEVDKTVELFVVLAEDRDGQLYLGSTRLESNSFPSMTNECPQVHLFEREIAEEWGVVPVGHPWLKPVRFVRSRREGHDAWGRSADVAPMVGVMDFYSVKGEEIHEVAVGPVHAGVIEPGHFRFQCHGEEVFHLEISLGYQHRGIERALLTKQGELSKRALHYVETLAGDTTIGHTTAYCHVVEALSECRVSARAHTLRGIALELERLANHTGDLGALANDVGFLPTASFCGRLRGDFLNLTASICGNRFGRSLLGPGGVRFDIDKSRADDMIVRLDAAVRDVEGAVDLLWNSPSVQARFEDTGQVSTSVATSLGLVGLAARASGVERDVRHDLPAGIFRLAQIPVSVWHSGDVFARAYVRSLEISRSAIFVREHLRALPGGVLRAPCGRAAPNSVCVSLVEGWRGEICHVAITNPTGAFHAYKVFDPSFHNWSGLAMALRNEQISDFPLCNKSFDLSYCGFDL
jgi:Ni,Fe-hydrogenase III large subunit/Ni,Fe-hydrogenase III component G